MLNGVSCLMAVVTQIKTVSKLLLVRYRHRNLMLQLCLGRAGMLELNMQAFCCPPYGQPNDQRVGRPGCTVARRAAGTYNCSDMGASVGEWHTQLFNCARPLDGSGSAAQ